MKVCVVGSGGARARAGLVAGAHRRGRGHAGQPGHAPGSAAERPLAITSITDRAAAEEVDAELFVIGPEAPLVDGPGRPAARQGRLVFGPGADGARLEGSKAFMKEVLDEAGVPTARYGVFDDDPRRLAFLRTLPGPYVVKTDGLAAGKGVLVTDSLAEAEARRRAPSSRARPSATPAAAW